jgi:hypothetical protein
MHSLGKARNAALFGVGYLLCGTAMANAQTRTDAAAQETPENTLPGSDTALMPPQDDPYLRLPDATGRVDPLMQRYLPTSRSLGQTARAETVMQRERPGYDAQGLAIGSFTWFPAVTTSATATNNVFRQEDGQSDAFLTGRAEWVLRSDWTRHALSFDGIVEQDLHAKYSSENIFNYRARFNGRLDLPSSDFLSMEAVQQRITQDRGSTSDILQTREPISFDNTGLMLGGQFGGRSRVQGQVEVAYLHREYNRAERPDGEPYDLSLRNLDDYRVTGQLGYRLGAMTNLFVSGSHTWRQFPNLVDRDATIVEVLGGVDGNVTPLIRGRLAVGYISANFESPLIDTRSAVAVDVRMDFLVTDLTTVRLTARRDFRNVVSVNSSAALATSVRAGLDHELFRNVILSPVIGYEESDYVDDERKADLITAELGARWLINRRLRANGLVQHRNRNVNGFESSRNFSDISVSAGLTFQI